MSSGSQLRDVDNEISQVSGRSMARNPGFSSNISTSSGIGAGGNSSCASQAGIFSHFRRLSNQRRIGSNVNKRTRKSRLPDNSPFLCHVVFAERWVWRSWRPSTLIKLVNPTLAPGQEDINGVILHRLLKTKPIYVRPSQQLLPSFMQVRTRNCSINVV